MLGATRGGKRYTPGFEAIVMAGLCPASYSSVIDIRISEPRLPFCCETIFVYAELTSGQYFQTRCMARLLPS